MKSRILEPPFFIALFRTLFEKYVLKNTFKNKKCICSKTDKGFPAILLPILLKMQLVIPGILAILIAIKEILLYFKILLIPMEKIKESIRYLR